MKVVVVFDGDRHVVDLDEEQEQEMDVEELKMILFSLTSVPPDQQELYAQPSEPLQNDRPISSVVTATSCPKNEQGLSILHLKERNKEQHEQQQQTSTPSSEDIARLLATALASFAQQPSSSSQQPSSSSASHAIAAASMMPAALDPPKRQMLARIRSAAQQVLQYENPVAQSKCLSLIPVAELEQQAREELLLRGSSVEEESEQDERAKHHLFRELLFVQLLKWYKHSFFSWVNAPPCDFCSGATNNVGMAQPTPEEQRNLAGRVELYQCTLCNTYTRFPRYNNVEKLLETRRGRCGEWAQAFVLCCRAMSYPARYVLDWTDHVWAEVYFEGKQRWVHADCCEAAFDSPLMYEAGWGKKLSYIIAVSREEVVDVTRRYTRNYSSQVLQRRTEVPEEWLQQAIQHCDEQQRRIFPRDNLEFAALLSRKESERRELLESDRRELQAAEHQGRISGSKEWRRARGELGDSGNSVGGASSTCSTLLQQPAPQPDESQNLFSYSSFLGQQQSLACVGSSFITGNSACLTPAQTGQQGALWRSEPLSLDLILKAGLVCRFAFQIKDGPSADGFAFVMQAVGANALGEGGCQLGYGGIPRSIAVEFDTYQTWDRCEDPDSNHISVQTRGKESNSAHHQYSLGCTADIPILADGRTHHCTIVYSQQKQEIFVYLDDDERPRLAVSRVKLEEIFSSNSSSASAVNVWIGFTAATGGLCQSHLIHSWSCSTSTQQKLIPKEQPVLFDTLQSSAVLNKLKEFNQTLAASSPSHLALSATEMKALDALLTNKLPKWNQSSALLPNEHSLLQKLLNWPSEYTFPVTDIARILVLSTAVAQHYSSSSNYSLLKPILSNATTSPSLANHLVMLRFVTNMFATEALTNQFLAASDGEEEKEDIVGMMHKSMEAHGKKSKNVQLALASALQNVALCIHQRGGISSYESLSTRCIDLLFRLVECSLDPDVTSRALVALGTMFYGESKEWQDKLLQARLQQKPGLLASLLSSSSIPTPLLQELTTIFSVNNNKD
ncbi:Peptide-N(4)-(N-acetyl-beta-glucosaminyl)asparagine amidase [Balamuthia mandrillaris]